MSATEPVCWGLYHGGTDVKAVCVTNDFITLLGHSLRYLLWILFQVPADVIRKLMSLDTPGLPPMKRCLQSEAGLVIQLDRPVVFHRVLRDFTPYLKPLPYVDQGRDVVILNCAPLHSCKSRDSLRLSHLRAVLIADHLAEVLKLKGSVNPLYSIHN